MKIFGICGSPRKGGNAEWCLQTFLAFCAKQGHTNDYVLLSETQLDWCNGSLPDEKDALPYNDAMPEIEQRMLNSDVIVFSSPTYFDNITPQLKNFIDRTDPFYEKLKGKRAVILVVGQANKESQKAAADYLKTYCDIAELQIAGVQSFRAAYKGDAQNIAGATVALHQLAVGLAEG